MSSSRRFARMSGVLLGLAFALSTSPASAEDPPTAPPQPKPVPVPAPAPSGGAIPPGLRGSAREQMWPAPTAEDWKKPCLIPWQRTWEDAQAVSKETARPILICINMDGEIASEHYAGVRYRSPDIAALYEPYVTVIASVYRHTPRDYDDEGRRILCPRFGSVTCGEHIALETAIYDKYEKGTRVSPRHIGVELDGREMYDVFYRNDTASVFQDIKDGIANRKGAPPQNVVRGDRPIVDRVGSHAREDREAVEAAYKAGDAALRRSLLDAALQRADVAPVDLLRLAIFGLDADLAKSARTALSKVGTPDAADLVAEALRAPMAPAERDALIATLAKMGETSPRARWLAVVQQGLTNGSSAVDAKRWADAREAGAPSPKSAFDVQNLEGEIQKKEEASKARPDDVESRLDLAESALALALTTPKTYTSDPRAARSFARRMYDASRRASLEAEALGAKGWRVDSVLALDAYYTDDKTTAYARAGAAVKDLPPGSVSWTSMSVLSVFAESRWKAIQSAVRERRNWPPEWLADIHAAHAVLLRHPLGTDAQVAWHCDFLAWLGARDQATRVLDAGLVRFSLSPLLHARLRERAAAKGPGGLEATYDAMLAAKDAPPELATFAGLASATAADQHRRARAFEEAAAAYGRAIAHFERAVKADASAKDVAEVGITMAYAGRARLAYQLDHDEQALVEILSALERRPDVAGDKDGVGITPGETAQMLLARLRTTKKDDLAAQLDAALAKIDPELLRPDRN